MEHVGQQRWDRDVSSRLFGKFLASEVDILPGSSPEDAGAQVQTALQLDPEFQKLQMQDRDLAQLTSEVITNEAISTMALLQIAGVRSVDMATMFKGHIEQVLGNYNSIMINMATLKHSYRAWMRAKGIKEMEPEPEPKPKKAPPSMSDEDEKALNRFWKNP